MPNAIQISLEVKGTVQNENPPQTVSLLKFITNKKMIVFGFRFP